MNEAETRAELIDPALRVVGWGVVEGSRIRREVVAPGRLLGRGARASQEKADYVLVYRNQKLAVIEAKRRGAKDTEGLGQAKNYAGKLHTRFAFSTNGIGIYRVDMATGVEGYVERYPSPDELWAEIYEGAETYIPPRGTVDSDSTEQPTNFWGRTTGEASGPQVSVWRNRFAAIPFEDKGGQWEPRYYQHNAITNVLETIARGKDRILLTLATGTGKTAIAFQIAWKLYHSRWNLTDWRKGLRPDQEPARRPRILFLADRNILADQAFNAFSAFADDALVRIDPEVIRKKGRVPKNGSVFFTIFQTFMTGQDAEGEPKPSFGDYPPDFFDFIVVDECHRGGANDESTWRAILEYFAPAVQLGLTATPRRVQNADTYSYFGEPVYIYSLKEGVNDGYLTPFKVKQIATTLDEYEYTPDDEVVEGEVDEGRRYGEADFNRVIEITERERKRVEVFMRDIDQRQKTLVFCATQEHALAVRDLINQMKKSTEPDYCVRVTANDGALGDRYLRTFQDNEKTIPTVLTTSQKLSTGVDARNVRNIVLMRPVNSMIEFKQIIGRGTRLYDGKDYFTIYDFVKAYEHFSDPEWDGEPFAPEPPRPRPPKDPEGEPVVTDPDDVYPDPDEATRRPKVVIKLADGKERTIQHMVATSFYDPSGRPISAQQFIERLYGELPVLFHDEDELRRLWSLPDTRRKLLEALEERGFGQEQLKELGRIIDAQHSDLYDVLAYIAYERPPITRADRVFYSRESVYGGGTEAQTEFLDFVLNQYVEEGVGELDVEKLPHLLELKYHGVADAVAVLGDVQKIRDTFVGFQKHLYSPSVRV